KSVDLCSQEQLESVYENVDVVFHCAALSSAWGTFNDFYNSNVLATKNVMACANKHTTKKIVYVSSSSIYFNYKNKLNIIES
ncbi:NAD(P)-dependent oxidoreductase, partial [bacterium LRH843]|nr:NAD(P)-dependent oxidoreductase [bacterium LRH843]